MGNLAELVVALRADASGYSKGVEQATKDNEKLNKSSGGLGGGFLSGAKAAMGFVGTAVGIASVGDALSAVKSYMEGAVQGAMDMQVAQAETNRILTSGSHVAGLTGQAVDALSTTMMNQTGVDDDVVRGAENILAGYANISNKAFPDVTKAALDMARAQSNATGQAFDAAGAARALGMAMEDPAKGARLLRQYNIILSQSQQDALKSALKHGDTLKAQGIILDAVKSKVNGASEAYKGTAAGGMMTFQTALGNIQKTIGTAILPILTQLLDKVAPIAQQFAANLPGAIKGAQDALGKLQPPFQWLISHVDMGKVVMGVLAAGFIIWAVSAGAAAVATIAATWPILAVMAAIGALIAIFVLAYTHWTGFRVAVQLAGRAIGTFAGFVGTVLGSVFGFLGRVKDAFGDAFGHIGEAIDKARAVVRAGIEAILELLSHIPGPAGDMARGVLNGMKAADDATRAHTEAMKASAAANTAAMAMAALKHTDEMRRHILEQLEHTKDPAKRHMLEMKLGVLAHTEEMQKKAVEHAQQLAHEHGAKMEQMKAKARDEAKAAKEGVLDHIGQMKDQALSKVGDFIGGVASFFQSLPGKIGSALGTAKDFVLNKINEIKDTFKRGLDKILGFFTGLHLEFPKIKMPHFSVNGSFSLNPPSVPKLDIQWYGTGGIFTSPQIVGLGDRPEAVIPLDRLPSMVGGGNGGNGNGNGQGVILNIDGRTIARAILPYLVNEIRNSGGIRSL